MLSVSNLAAVIPSSPPDPGEFAAKRLAVTPAGGQRYR